MKPSVVDCIRLHEDSKLPTRGTQGAAGMDLYAYKPGSSFTIEPGAVVKVPTGIAVHIADPNLVGLIAVRSGLATKRHVTLINAVGVIDSDYQGELMVTLVNHGKEKVEIAHHERFAQLLVMPVMQSELREVKEFPSSSRGSGGHGSTGRF